jgi:hypothetical protein
MNQLGSTPAPSVTNKPNRGRRSEVLAGGGVAVLLALGALAGGAREADSGHLDADQAPAEGEAVADPPREPIEPPTTVVPETTTTTEDPLIFTPLIHDGEGDTVLDITAIGDKPAMVHAVFTGSRNNALWAVDGNGEQVELLVNTIGTYDGTALMQESFIGTPTHLQVQATGGWHIEVLPLSQVTRVAGPHAGAGDQVFFAEQSGIATLTHDGSRNFAVWAYGNDSIQQLLVNTIGAYSGEVIVPGPEGALVAVMADGNWSYTPTG